MFRPVRASRLQTIAGLSLLVALVSALPAEAAWSARKRLTWTSEAEDYPTIAVSGCTVHVAWIDHDRRELHYARSTDAGTTWSDMRVLARNDGRPVMAAEIAAERSRVHVLWQEGASAEASIHYRRRTSSGRSFRATRQLSGLGKPAEQPSLAIDGDHVYAVWMRARQEADTRLHPKHRSRSKLGDSETTRPSLAGPGGSPRLCRRGSSPCLLGSSRTDRRQMGASDHPANQSQRRCLLVAQNDGCRR